MSMHCIIAGFDPFGKNKSNPSEQLVRAMRPEIVAQETVCKIERIVLPTCCEGWETLESGTAAARGGGQPFLLLMCGLAESRERISLERFGLNVRQYRIPDNSGHARNDEYIIEGAPDAIRTRFNLPELARELAAAGFGIEISNHAGSFVCNETYFRALNAWQDAPGCLGVLFIHLPLLETYANFMAKNDPRHLPPPNAAVVQEYSRMLEHIIGYAIATSGQPA